MRTETKLPGCLVKREGVVLLSCLRGSGLAFLPFLVFSNMFHEGVYWGMLTSI